jgi:tRNA-specific 2-thiouridylase
MNNISPIKQNISTKSRKQKVFVGMSGGVDSSVSAALLKKAGYDVTGVFIKVWQPDWIECTWRDERREAMRAAAHLGVPFVTLDLEKEYKQGVIDYMIAEYAVGRTPNPDVMCNREVKFGAFWRWAKEQGADFVATGHYCQVVDLKMLAGVDKNKDQSYFLWTLNQGDLNHILFPIGHLEKPEVRKLAQKFGLPNADKKDSQGLCFIGKIDVKDFLAHYIKREPGKVLNEKGDAIGIHEGALLITIGERRGFTIDAKHKTPNDEPYYVVSKDVENNTITVANKKIQDFRLKIKDIKISRVNWTSGTAPKIGEQIQIRIRYRQPLVKATVKSSGGSLAIIVPEKEIEAVTPGQSLVMYDGVNGEECLGGGIIE